MELILVDNNSTDNTFEILSDYAVNNNNIIVAEEKKQGANNARNTGIEISSGNYLIFFDSDDYMYPDCLSTIYKELQKNNFPDILTYQFYIISEKKKKTIRPKNGKISAPNHLFDPIMATHNFCIKKTHLKNTGKWDINLQRWQDFEFGYRLLLNTKNIIKIKNDPLYEVYEHKNSISGNTYTQDHEKLYQAIKKIDCDAEIITDEKKKYINNIALCYKISTIAQIIKQENKRVAVRSNLDKKYLKMAIEKLPKKHKIRNSLIIKAGYFYTGLGGRGFWRIAKKLM